MQAGTLGELLSNQQGFSYAKIAPGLEQIAQCKHFGSVQYKAYHTAWKQTA